MLFVVLSRFRYEFRHSSLCMVMKCLLCGCFFGFTLQEDKDSSSSSEADDDVGGSVEGAAIAVDEPIVFGVAAAKLLPRLNQLTVLLLQPNLLVALLMHLRREVMQLKWLLRGLLKHLKELFQPALLMMWG